MLRIKYIWSLLVIFVLVSCEEGKYDREIEPPIEVVSGEADFTRYVAIGNSLTAGFADGALFIASQTEAFPNLLSQKMALTGGGEFTTPWMNDNTGGLLLGGEPFPGQGPRLFFNGTGLDVLPGTPTTEISNIQPGPYNNMGVPGAKSFHLLANGYGNLAGLALGLANPYYVRMASSSNASVLEDALAINPTFFSLWIGANDVLGYARTGGDGSDPITPQPIFDGSMAALITALTGTGAKGVVANIPNVLEGAYFTAVLPLPLDPLTNEEYAAQIPLLNGAYAQLNQAFAFLGVPERSVVFDETEPSGIVIYDETLADISAQLNQVLILGGLDPLTAGLLSQQYAQSRQSNIGDKITLPASNVIASVNAEYFAQLVGLGVPAEQAGQLSVNGLTYPMADTFVLIPSEQIEIDQATMAFNQTIEQLASNAGLAFLDSYALINEAADTGYSADGFTVTTDFIGGGLFSLDGLHLTARGNAIIANEMMMAIDFTYGSNFEEAGELNKLGDHPTIYSPALQ